MALPPIPTLREVLKILNLKACKQLSQNFLLQPKPIQFFVKSVGTINNNTHILEVGPGPGGLTLELLKHKPSKIVVVELDRRFLIILEDLKKIAFDLGTKIEIYNQDILKFNSSNIFPEVYEDISQIHPHQRWDLDFKSNDREIVDNNNYKTVQIIGNLPFNISTKLLSNWLHDISERRGLWSKMKVPMTLSFQKEVGYRLIASIHDPERCRYSIICNSLCETKVKGTIKGSTFLPKANVDTVIITLTPRIEPKIRVPYPYMDKFLRVIFQFKSKKLINGIQALFPPEFTNLILEFFSQSHVDPDLYLIDISNDQYKSMIECYYQLCCLHPEIFNYEFRDKQNVHNYRKRKSIQKEILNGNTINAEYLKSIANC